MRNGAMLPVMAGSAAQPTVPVNLQMTMFLATVADVWRPIAAIYDSGFADPGDLFGLQGQIRRNIAGLGFYTSTWSHTDTIKVALPSQTMRTAMRTISWQSYANLAFIARDRVDNPLRSRPTFGAGVFSWLDRREESLADQFRGWTQANLCASRHSWGHEVLSQTLDTDPEVALLELLYPEYVVYTLSQREARLRLRILKRLLLYIDDLAAVAITVCAFIVRLSDFVDHVTAIIRTFMAHRHSRESADGLLQSVSRQSVLSG